MKQTSLMGRSHFNRSIGWGNTDYTCNYSHRFLPLVTLMRHIHWSFHRGICLSILGQQDVPTHPGHLESYWIRRRCRFLRKVKWFYFWDSQFHQNGLRCRFLCEEDEPISIPFNLRIYPFLAVSELSFKSSTIGQKKEYHWQWARPSLKCRT